MKDKKIYLYIGIVLSLIIVSIIVVCYIIHKNNSTKMLQKVPTENNNTSLPTINIQSTNDNPIKTDNVEVKNIKVVNNEGDVQVVTTLKNNSNEKIEGFFIVISLLDEQGQQVTSIVKSSEETIEANGEFSFLNSVTGCDDAMKIKNAKIVTIEKNSSNNNAEKFFTETQEEFQNNE